MTTLTSLENLKYKVIYADPPWEFVSWSEKGNDRGVTNHYPIMKMNDISSLPVSMITEENAICFMWTTDPLLPKQIKVLEDWGFTYKTVGFVWIKMNKVSNTPFIGLGYYTRSNPEYCLIGVKGSIGRPKNKSISEVIISPIREHSRKPDIVRKYIMEMYDGPYLELFAREEIDGWDSWGNETNKFNNKNTSLF